MFQISSFLPMAIKFHEILLILFWIHNTNGVAIDNGILGTPTVQCGTDRITLLYQTAKPFNGRVFVKGYAYQTECSAAGNNQITGQFGITFTQCGVRRSRQITGIALSATVIISFHNLFLTKVDKAYRVNCFYMESSKHVTQNIDVSMLTTIPLDGQVAMPICRYEILTGSQQGTPVRFARIGDPVYHKWTCDSDTPDTFCMRVHSCTVDDGAGGQRVQVLDADGCSIDQFVLQNLVYTSDLMAGQEAHVFKFADRPALFFNCEIEIRLKDSNFGCANVQPNCVSAVVQPTPVPYSGAAIATQQQQYAQPNPYLSVQTTQAAYRGSANVPNFRASGSYLPVSTQYNAAGNVASQPQSQPPSGQPYLAALKRLRRELNEPDVNPLVAGYDLPQKRITVFDIDAGVDETDSTEEELAEARRIVDLLTQPSSSRRQLSMALDNMVCLTHEKFVGYAAALAGVSITSVTILSIVFLRRKSIFSKALPSKA